MTDEPMTQKKLLDAWDAVMKGAPPPMPRVIPVSRGEVVTCVGGDEIVCEFVPNPTYERIPPGQALRAVVGFFPRVEEVLLVREEDLHLVPRRYE